MIHLLTQLTNNTTININRSHKFPYNFLFINLTLLMQRITSFKIKPSLIHNITSFLQFLPFLLLQISLHLSIKLFQQSSHITKYLINILIQYLFLISTQQCNTKTNYSFPTIKNKYMPKFIHNIH